MIKDFMGIMNDINTAMIKVSSLKTDEVRFSDNWKMFIEQIKENIDATAIYSFNNIDASIQMIKSKYKKKELKNVELQISLGTDTPIIIEEITPDDMLGNQIIIAPMVIDKIGEFKSGKNANEILSDIKNTLNNYDINDLSGEGAKELLKIIENRIGDKNE
jgi:hypothetical protein